MPPEGFETAIPAKQAAAHLHFRKCSHWDRLEAINNTERGKHVQCVVLCEILIGGTRTHTHTRTRTHANKNTQETIDTRVKVSQSQIWISNHNFVLQIFLNLHTKTEQ